jgi:hypothetical protein
MPSFGFVSFLFMSGIEFFILGYSISTIVRLVRRL